MPYSFFVTTFHHLRSDVNQSRRNLITGKSRDKGIINIIISSPLPPHLLQYCFSLTFRRTPLAIVGGNRFVKMNVSIGIDILGKVSNRLRSGTAVADVVLLSRLQFCQLGLVLGLPLFLGISVWNVGDGC